MGHNFSCNSKRAQTQTSESQSCINTKQVELLFSPCFIKNICIRVMKQTRKQKYSYMLLNFTKKAKVEIKNKLTDKYNFRLNTISGNFITI